MEDRGPLQGGLDKKNALTNTYGMDMAAVLPKIERLPPQIAREVSDYADFLIQKYAVSVPKPKAGCMRGTFTRMSDDFNAPLEDFRDYQ